MKLLIQCEEAIEPRCRHFGLCGGCRYQHISYDEQLAHKKNFVSSCFKRETLPIIPCDPFWQYRNKMEFSFSQDRSGTQFLGLMRRRGRVENLDECHLTKPWFIETVKSIREWWSESSLKAYYPPANAGHLRTLILREGFYTGEKMAVLTLSEEAISDSCIASLKERLPHIDALILRRQITRKKVPTYFEESVIQGDAFIHEVLHDASGRSFLFRIRAASFFQPNTLQAEVIYQNALALAELKPQDVVLDLYCGTGTVGIFAASQVSTVLGIELIKEAVEDAYINIQANRITNMSLHEGDVSTSLAQLNLHPDVIIVDPPRSGLGTKAIAELLILRPKKIVYISCNPQSQAADVLSLLENGAYGLEQLQPIDQFPHTPHVENIALLRKVK